MSKHVLMSNYSQDVRLAGEVWKTGDGEIHFNVNSGTYKPTKDMIEKGEKVLRRTFPGVVIRGNK